MKVLIAGGTGFVGKQLVSALLARGDQIHVMSRTPAAATTAFGGRATGVGYDASLEGYDAVVNLAGAGIADKRWSEERKRELLESRTKPTSALSKGLASVTAKPKVLVNASAIGFYGDRGDETLDEASKPGTGLLPDICVKWEESVAAAKQAGIRVVLLRIGVVLGDGGALKKMVPPFKMFVGGKLGSGRQWMSWIHVTDLVRMILHCIDTPSVTGPVNGTAPEPVTNAEFSKALGKALSRPSFAPVPGFMLKLMLGEMASMLLGGQRVLPKVAMASGFGFQFPKVSSALEAALKR